MSDSARVSLKKLFNPSVEYYGEWELGKHLDTIALIGEKTKLDTFIERYYTTPLAAILKDEELAKSFKWGVCSREVNGKRTLFFSKIEFVRNITESIDNILYVNGEQAYADVKKALRIKKDMYRDVSLKGNESEYYKTVKKAYSPFKKRMTFDQYVNLYKKKYTRILSGYNVILEFLNKPIDVDKFIDCFNVDQLYLFAVHSILEANKNYYKIFGKVNYDLFCLEDYRQFVAAQKKTNKFYNSCIIVDGKGRDVVYTIDDLFKDYDKLLSKVNDL